MAHALMVAQVERGARDGTARFSVGHTRDGRYRDRDIMQTHTFTPFGTGSRVASVSTDGSATFHMLSKATTHLPSSSHNRILYCFQISPHTPANTNSRFTLPNFLSATYIVQPYRNLPASAHLFLLLPSFTNPPHLAFHVGGFSKQPSIHPHVNGAIIYQPP